MTCYTYNWVFLSTILACPVGYTVLMLNSTRACLRFVATPTTYTNARLDCSADNGDLVKIDTPFMRLIFLHFIKGVLILHYHDKVYLELLLISLFDDFQ